jgi:hypothetical protein
MLDATLAGEGSFSRMRREGDQPVTIANVGRSIGAAGGGGGRDRELRHEGRCPRRGRQRDRCHGVAASHVPGWAVGAMPAGFARSIPVAAGAGRAGAGLLAEGAVLAGDAVLMAHEALSDMRRSSPRGGLR